MKRLLLLFALIVGGLVLVASPAFAPCHSITFANEPYSVAENAGKITITVTNGAGQQMQDQTVDYQTVNGTAKSGSDFVGKSGKVMFGANTHNSELSFDIVIKDNKIHENTETFAVQLTNAPPPSTCPGFTPTIDESSATVTITDNDAVLHQPTPTPTPTPTASSPKPTPKPTKSASPTPSPSTESPTPSPTTSAIATADNNGGGLSGGALAGIVVVVLAGGGTAAFFVRRRFLT